MENKINTRTRAGIKVRSKAVFPIEQITSFYGIRRFATCQKNVHKNKIKTFTSVF